MIKIKAKELFAIEENKLVIDKMNGAIENFLNHPYRSGALKYDVQNKLGKAVRKEIEEIASFRERLCNELPPEAEGNIAEINIKLVELLNSEIVIEAQPVRLSLLLNEDCSAFDFNALDKFIVDDRGL